MANNTQLNSGSGGDILRTDDVGGPKIPISKISTGGAGVDGGVVTAANPFQVVIASGSQGVGVTGVSLNVMPQSGSVTGLLVGGVAAGLANPVPVTASAGILVGGVAVGQANPVPVSGSAGILVAGALVTTANPLPVTGTVALSRGVTVSSGSVTGLLVGGVNVSNAAPLPVSAQSGSVIGLLVGGIPLSHTNPLPMGSAWDQSGQVISGSIVRTVQYAFGDFASGSANQVVAPQGANNRIRLLSAHVMTPNAATLRWTSTGSVGSITNISGLSPVPANGGYVLPFNQHGWFQTNANEGLNLSLNTAGGTAGVTISWIVVGP